MVVVEVLVKVEVAVLTGRVEMPAVIVCVVVTV